ncbi:hypothetical protein D1819_12525 [Pseudoalteromonas tunicata]|jgi:hypothetical protein|nr:hypothetical protein D1819_12525 [Pseudoalteromonas tunicata]
MDENMFFFTSQQQYFKSPVSTVVCECQNKVNMQAVSRLDYVSFGIIPFFAYRITRCYECATCGHQQDNIQVDKFIPWYQIATKFVGLMILATAMLLFYFQYQYDKNLQKSIIETPQVNDFYLIDYSLFRQESYYQKQFMVVKVIAADTSHIAVQLANYRYQRKNQVIKAIKLDNLIKPYYFSKEIEQLKRVRVAELFEQGVSASSEA